MEIPSSEKFRDVSLSLLRFFAGFTFFQHGAQKLFGWFGGEQVEALVSIMGLAGVLEFFGGLLILAGLFTRPVAFVLSGEMAVAYFMAHFPRGFWPIMNGGELAVLYAFIFLYLFARGGGSYSLDALRGAGGAAEAPEGPPAAGPAAGAGPGSPGSGSPPGPGGRSR